MTVDYDNLPKPRALPEGGLRIVPLGGLGEVGRNMNTFEYDGKILIVDCGVLFPEMDQRGVDLILPDYTYIEDRLDDVVGIVVTHGHEDHIGGVPYLLKLRGDIPIYGSQLTLALLEAKLREHRITPDSHTVAEGQTAQLGPFSLEFVAVNHSIPDALAVAITTGAGTVLETGDFKLDQLPLDGRITDLRTFARLGEAGVDLFMADSTNAHIPGFVTSERELRPAIEQVFDKAPGRIIASTFSSHVHRVQQVVDAAARHHRKVVFVGRSMVRNMTIAADLGYLHVPDGILTDLKHIGDLPDDRLTLVCTGSQGETMAALGRMATGDHQIKLGDSDTVLLCSSLIPGNENSVYGMINALMKLGCTVVHKGNAKVHVSGHAAAGELLYCYNIVQPRNAMPIHGEVRHLLASGELAKATGVPEPNVVIAQNGTVVDLVDGLADIVGQVDCGDIFVDGASVGEITAEDLEDRRTLGDEGFVSVFVALDTRTGEVVGGPEVATRGIAEQATVFDQLVPKILSALDEVSPGSPLRSYQQEVRRTVGRWVSHALRRRPMIVPVVMDISKKASARR